MTKYGGNVRLFRLTKGTGCLWFDQSVEMLTQNGDVLFGDRPSVHLNDKISFRVERYKNETYNVAFFFFFTFLLF